MDKEKVIKRVVERRKELKMSQLELAERIGMTNQYWGQVELGKHVPNISVILEAIKVLGLEIEIKERNE